jgi:hypothetical protein
VFGQTLALRGLSALLALAGFCSFAAGDSRAQSSQSIVCPKLPPPAKFETEAQFLDWTEKYNEHCLHELGGVVRTSGVLLYVRLVNGSEARVLRPFMVSLFFPHIFCSTATTTSANCFSSQSSCNTPI